MRGLEAVRALAVPAVLCAAVLVGCGDDAEETAAEIEDVVVAYGASNGAEACDYLGASALDQLGGESGCTREFENVPPAEFAVEETAVEDGSATVTVCNVEFNNAIELGLAEEDGEWKIVDYPTLNPEEGVPPDQPCAEQSGARRTEPDAQELEEELERGEGPPAAPGVEEELPPAEEQDGAPREETETEPEQ